MFSKEELIEFENEMAACFDAAMIRAPVHLYHGNEDEIIKVFKDNNIGPEDWVMCSWRSHYQCLLKGVPPDELKEAILQGRSISLCFARYRVLSSGIKYARNHKLPIHFVIEDNGKSVCTDTRATWAQEKLTYEDVNDDYITYYKYKLDKYPHAGAGKRVQF
jgi:pyruvate dehydrogenase E1 component alpha subunit